jgi:hypothetical protein
MSREETKHAPGEICTINTLLKRAYFRHVGFRLNNEQVRQIYERDGGSHDELVSALKDIIADFEDRGVTEASINKAREALKKAEKDIGR